MKNDKDKQECLICLIFQIPKYIHKSELYFIKQE